MGNAGLSRSDWLEKVRLDGNALQHCPCEIQYDYEVVLEAVKNQPDALKYAPREYRKDRYLQFLYGVGTLPVPSGKPLICVSKRYGLVLNANDFPIAVLRQLLRIDFIRTTYEVNDPDMEDPGFCKGDITWDRVTDFSYPCRGDSSGPGKCRRPVCLADGQPTTGSCWRYCCKWNVNRGVETGGFCLQFVEMDQHGMLNLGHGQRIDEDIALRSALPILTVRQPQRDYSEQEVKTAADGILERLLLRNFGPGYSAELAYEQHQGNRHSAPLPATLLDGVEVLAIGQIEGMEFCRPGDVGTIVSIQSGGGGKSIDILWDMYDRQSTVKSSSDAWGVLLKLIKREITLDRGKWLQRVQEDGNQLRHAPVVFQEDYEFVLAAVLNQPRALKFAKKHQNDPLLLWKSGIGNQPMAVHKKKVICVSKKYSLKKEASDFSVHVVRAVMAHDYFKDKFTLYNPDCFDKGFCATKDGPLQEVDWSKATSFDWSCRGCQNGVHACRRPVCLADGRATEGSCWRYSYQQHERESVRTGGFLLQIVELFGDELKLGDGQVIEEDIARIVGCPILTIRQSNADEAFVGVSPESIDELVKKHRRGVWDPGFHSI